MQRCTNSFKMTRQSYHFDCQYRRYCFQITYYFLMFSVILLGYFSSGVKQPSRSSSCDESSSDQLMQCGYNPNYCIISENVCNKFIDCSDGSDESNATCNKVLACDEKPEPVCLNGGTCRSVVGSATRLAHHECDCIAPFTGATCSEISTTILSPTTDSARPSTSTAVGGTSTNVILTTILSPTTDSDRSSTSTAVGRTPTIVISTTILSPMTNSARPSASTAVVGTPTSVTSKYGSTTQGITSQTSNIPQTESTLFQTEHSNLSNNSSPVTNSLTLPDESMSNITSQSSSTTTSLQTTLAFTEVSYQTVEKTTPPPVHTSPPPKRTRPAKNNHTTTKPTTKTSPKPQKPNNSPPDYRTTIILVIVFGLIFLMTVSIFIHCRLKRKPSHANFSQKSKKDDKEVLTQNNKMDLNNKTQEVIKPKTNHQRNVSISAIITKENSNLLGNEMPLDVNMNSPQPAPPTIRVTYAPDVNSEPPIGSSSSYTNDMTDHPHYPETQMWMPGDGSEETPYFVTVNGPLPVSFV